MAAPLGTADQGDMVTPPWLSYQPCHLLAPTLPLGSCCSQLRHGTCQPGSHLGTCHFGSNHNSEYADPPQDIPILVTLCPYDGQHHEAGVQILCPPMLGTSLALPYTPAPILAATVPDPQGQVQYIFGIFLGSTNTISHFLESSLQHLVSWIRNKPHVPFPRDGWDGSCCSNTVLDSGWGLARTRVCPAWSIPLSADTPCAK